MIFNLITKQKILNNINFAQKKYLILSGEKLKTFESKAVDQ